MLLVLPEGQGSLSSTHTESQPSVAPVPEGSVPSSDVHAHDAQTNTYIPK